MTREEAIECLDYQNDEFFGGQSEALKMAISALSESEGKWIPVSSGELPKIGQRVLATIETYDDGLKVVDTMYDKRGFMCGNALAWQPLPSPWKGE